MTTSAEPVGRSAPQWGRIARNVLIAAGVVALYWQAWVRTEANLTELFTSFHNLARIVGEIFPPDWSVLHASINGAIVTFDTALLGTTIAFAFSIVLAPLAARNLTPHRVVYEVVRAVIGFLRTIPLWVSGLLFLVAVGISP